MWLVAAAVWRASRGGYKRSDVLIEQGHPWSLRRCPLPEERPGPPLAQPPAIRALEKPLCYDPTANGVALEPLFW